MLATVMVLFSLFSFGDTDQWSKTFSTDGSSQFRIVTSDANIRVETWEKASIEARVTTRGWKIGEDGIRIIDRQSGDAVDIEIRFPRMNFNFNGWKNRSVEIEVKVPRSTRLDLRTGDGNVDVRGIEADIKLHSGDGNIKIENVQGRLDAHTGDGNIEIRGSKGDISLETGDGRIELDSADGSLRADTGDGPVRVSGRFDVLDLKTGDGRIEAEAVAGSRMTSDWTLRTGDGSLSLRVPEDFSAEVDIETNDGDIDLDMPVTVSGKTERKSVRGRLGSGGSVLTMKSGDGSIRLLKTSRTSGSSRGATR
jgi:DUF4097 and DUF4098 domain-containing protein YvlB